MKLPALPAWFELHIVDIATLGALSALLLAVTVFATPRLVASLPADYFARPRTPIEDRDPLRLLVLLLRSLLGLVALLFGLIMLVTPGPGIVMLLIGLSLVEFPGKHTMLLRLATRPKVFASLNWLRERRARPPFEPPAL